MDHKHLNHYKWKTGATKNYQVIYTLVYQVHVEEFILEIRAYMLTCRKLLVVYNWAWDTFLSIKNMLNKLCYIDKVE
jgi:hypothetical protein